MKRYLIMALLVLSGLLWIQTVRLQGERAERSGVPADSRITATNRDVMVPVVAAMSFVGNGVEAKMSDVQSGWDLFIKG